MSNTDRDSMLERWADGMDKLEKYYEDLYGPPATPAVLPSVTDPNGMLESIADGLEQAVININKTSPVFHNKDVAYTKVVPVGPVHEASIEKIGGMTIVWNQLVNSTSPVATISGHKYYTFVNKVASIITSDGSSVTINNAGDDMVCDLTVMFGAGNEPASADEFKAMFPLWHYPYNAGTLINAVVTSISTEAGNLFDDAEFFGRIPGSSRVDGGWRYWASNGYKTYTPTYSTNPSKIYSGENLTISFDVRTDSSTYVGKTVIVGFRNPNNSTVNEIQVPLTTDYVHYSATIQNANQVKVYLSYSNDAPYVIKNFQITETAEEQTYEPHLKSIFSVPSAVQSLAGYGLSCPGHYNYVDLETKKFVQEVGTREYVAGDESDSTVITDGTNTNYPLNPAVETDVSEYLPDSNIIDVESGEVLSFVNSNGDDYRIPVPSTETFWVEL